MKMKIIQNTDPEKWEQEINTFNVNFEVKFTQTHINKMIYIDGGDYLKYTAILYYEVKK